MKGQQKCFRYVETRKRSFFFFCAVVRHSSSSHLVAVLGLQLAQRRLELLHALQRFKRRAFQMHVHHRQPLAADRATAADAASAKAARVGMAAAVISAAVAAAIRAALPAAVVATATAPLGEHVHKHARAVALPNG